MLYLCTDIENPVINNMPTNINEGTDTGLASAIVSWSEPTATDNSGTQTLTWTHSSGSVFNIGDTVVKYSSIDSSGNQRIELFTVTVYGEYFY